MTNYETGQKVLTKVDGAEVEATIVKVTIDLEVRIPDGTTRWRASTKIRPVETAPAALSPATAGEPVEAPVAETPVSAPEPPAPETAPAEVSTEEAAPPEASEAPEQAPAPEPGPEPEPGTAAGSPEPAPTVERHDKSRNRRKGRR